jgi:hypothetical protein
MTELAIRKQPGDAGPNPVARPKTRRGRGLVVRRRYEADRISRNLVIKTVAKGRLGCWEYGLASHLRRSTTTAYVSTGPCDKSAINPINHCNY